MKLTRGLLVSIKSIMSENNSQRESFSEFEQHLESRKQHKREFAETMKDVLDDEPELLIRHYENVKNESLVKGFIMGALTIGVIWALVIAF